ncbi:MAG: 2'-5' RNA ligase family protein [Reyranella sp.]|nr:2'-5' RNA ligase family protein [Reyranella sp.]
MLYVAACPVLAEADDTALRRLRAQYHPREAGLIGPHITLMFGAPPARETELRTALAELVERRPFWVVIDRMVRHDLTPPSRAAYLYAAPADGTIELSALHDALNPLPGEEPFEPHITLGLFDRAAEAEQIARIVERQKLLPMHARIEALVLLARDGDALTEIGRFQFRG